MLRRLYIFCLLEMLCTLPVFSRPFSNISSSRTSSLFISDNQTFSGTSVVTPSNYLFDPPHHPLNDYYEITTYSSANSFTNATENLFFSDHQTALTLSAKKKIKQFYTHYLKNSHRKIYITPSCTLHVNEKVAMMQAEKVAQYFQLLGVSKNQIIIKVSKHSLSSRIHFNHVILTLSPYVNFDPSAPYQGLKYQLISE